MLSTWWRNLDQQVSDAWNTLWLFTVLKFIFIWILIIQMLGFCWCCFFLIIKEAFPNKSVLFWSFDLIFQPSCSFVMAVNFFKTCSWMNNQYYKTTFFASTWVYVEKLLNIIEKWDAIKFVHFINWAIRVCLLVLFDFI